MKTYEVTLTDGRKISVEAERVAFGNTHVVFDYTEATGGRGNSGLVWAVNATQVAEVKETR